MKTIGLIALTFIAQLTCADSLSRIGGFTRVNTKSADPFAVTSYSSGNWQAEEVKFRVSRVGKFNAKEDRETLLLLFDRIKESVKTATKPGNDFDVEILQHVEKHTYLALPITGYSYGYPKYGERIAIDLSADYADGDKVTAQNLAASGFYSYTDTAGAGRRVRHWKPSDGQAIELSKETFVELLKTGETFKVELIESHMCQVCKGDGTVHGDAQKGQDPDKDYKCPTCRGNKSLKVKVPYLVSWN